jgi:hypothetical protein
MIVIAAVAIVSAWLNIPPAILLVITGVVLALIPGVPTVELAPEFVLLLVLPPAIYSSEVAMSWRDFRYYIAAGRGLRLVHDHRDCRDNPLAVGPPVAGRLCLGCALEAVTCVQSRAVQRDPAGKQ